MIPKKVRKKDNPARDPPTFQFGDSYPHPHKF